MIHEKFHYRTREELEKKAEELGVYIPLAKDTSVLSTPCKAKSVIFSNRLGVAPMEGAGFFARWLSFRDDIETL